MKRLISITAVFAVIIILMGAIFTLTEDKHKNDPSGRYAVTLNRIENYINNGETEKAAELSAELRSQMTSEKTRSDAGKRIAAVTAVSAFMTAAMGIYCAVSVVRPFEKLTAFADNVANGDFDLPLDYERSNYFGKFTWAFDHMRREIVKARSCEREAIENNKTVIASLSHDIKTPVASVRAYAEALDLGMDCDSEKRSEYLSVIMSKCDEVSKLTDDMLLHSLSDLGKLKVTPEVFELGAFAEKTVRELSADGSIQYTRPSYSVYVSADRLRTAQAIENLINNARKYAAPPVEVSVSRAGDNAVITVRDHGNGIPDEDMPFVTGKFYRGHNCGDANGSGLGLFIVNYIAEQSDGELKLKNHPDGLEAVISLPVSE